MKIIKSPCDDGSQKGIYESGHIPKGVFRFECSFCKCIFEAEKGEYSLYYSYNRDISFYAADCPFCGKKAKFILKEV